MGNDNSKIPENRKTIDELSELLDELVLCAKEGNFARVYEILGPPSKPVHAYLLNAIPQRRRWGVLHQAVYWQDPNDLQKLLKYPGCDVSIKAKRCASEVGDTGGMTPREIAKAYGHEQLVDAIKGANQISFEIQTFRSIESYTSDTKPCLLEITIAAFKKTFHPKRIDPRMKLFNLLENIYNDIDRHPDHWEEVRDVVADSVYTVNKHKADDLLRCEMKYDFFSQVVNCYTDEHNTIYAFINIAFRRQTDRQYLPSAQDLAMGPYCLMYHMLLLFWQELEPDTGTTYRKMLMRESDLKMYTKGTKFVWPAVVSSAVKKIHVQAFPTAAGAPKGDMVVLFEIDNSTTSKWQPRNIEKHAEFEESERTYPAGAKFEITERENKDDATHIRMRLLA